MGPAEIVNRRQVLLGAGAGGLGLFALTTLAPTAAGAATNGEHDSEEGSVAGSWLVTITVTADVPGPPFVFQGVVGFARGGVLTTISSNGSPAGLGTWKDTGENGGFAFTFLSPDTDQNNVPTGGFDKIRGTGNHTGNHITGNFKIDGFDGNGNPTFSGTGTIDGHRVAIEPL